jgi:hypothetical protein
LIELAIKLREEPVSTLVFLQTNADFAGFIVAEFNAGLLESLLYLEDRGEIPFHNPLILLDPLQRRQPHACVASKLVLVPTQERTRRKRGPILQYFLPRARSAVT